MTKNMTIIVGVLLIAGTIASFFPAESNGSPWDEATPAPSATPEIVPWPTDSPVPQPTPVPSPVKHSFKWNTAKASFYDYNTWGKDKPGGMNGIFACGGWYLRYSIGVAHRTLPCGTIVRLCYQHECINVPVRDRFYGAGFDLTSEACLRIHHCFTGPIKWRIVK